MQKNSPLRGLTRVPYYPELEVFSDKSDPNDESALVLSCMLYWDSLDCHRAFNSRQHALQLARSLRTAPEIVLGALGRLASMGLLDRREESFETNSDDPAHKVKTDVFYSVNFHKLRTGLLEHGIPVPAKVLRLAADDSFDFFTYISPYRLPLEQKLVGTASGMQYEAVARAAARLVCALCSDESLDEFCTRSLAPGWRMLAQPPCTAGDIAGRWLRQGERAIDLDLMDGTFFLPDADVFGTDCHVVLQGGKAREPKDLAAALLLCCAGTCHALHFASDLRPQELLEGIRLCKALSGVEPVIGDAYFESLDLMGEDRAQAEGLLESAGAVVSRTSDS
ncbi:MAG: hypothetical protein ACI4NA_08505 [Succinivibrio sp.]